MSKAFVLDKTNSCNHLKSLDMIKTSGQEFAFEKELNHH